MDFLKSLIQRAAIVAVIAPMFCATDSHAGDSLVVQTLSELSHRPADTIDAERVRIWLPLERGGNCRVRINILDSLNHTIRSLVNRLMYGGYYNFYWNKRDDHGRFVKPGRYRYAVDNCGDRSYGELEVLFHRWELASRIDRMDSIPDKVWLMIDDDSAIVSINIMNRRGRFIVQSMADSLMSPGRHELQWIPSKSGYTGVYQMLVNVGGYTHPPIEIRAGRRLK